MNWQRYPTRYINVNIPRSNTSCIVPAVTCAASAIEAQNLDRRSWSRERREPERASPLPSIRVTVVHQQPCRRHTFRESIVENHGSFTRVWQFTQSHRERELIAREVTDRDAQKHWQDYEVRCWYDGRQRRWRRKEREGARGKYTDAPTPTTGTTPNATSWTRPLIFDGITEKGTRSRADCSSILVPLSTDCHRVSMAKKRTPPFCMAKENRQRFSEKGGWLGGNIRNIGHRLSKCIIGQLICPQQLEAHAARERPIMALYTVLLHMACKFAVVNFL